MIARLTKRMGVRVSLAPLPPAARWVALVTVSLAFAGALNAMRLPAAFLLGPLAAGRRRAVQRGAKTVWTVVTM